LSQASFLGSAPTAFTRDQFKSWTDLSGGGGDTPCGTADDERLNDAVLPN